MWEEGSKTCPKLEIQSLVPLFPGGDFIHVNLSDPRLGEDVKEMLRLLQPQLKAGFAIAQWISVEGDQSSSPLADRFFFSSSVFSFPFSHIIMLAIK